MDDGNRLRAVEELDAQLVSAFSQTSAIALAIMDDEQHYLFVNSALVAMHNRAPAEAFSGSTFRDILEDAAPEVDRRFRRVAVLGETPALEVRVKLPSRTELGYWIEKNFAIKRKSGSVIQITSLAVEVTAEKKLEQCFRKLAGELLSTNQEYQRLARELHESINGYHAALRMNLERLSRCTSKPEKIPELLTQSMEFMDVHMRKLVSAIARCFPVDRHRV